MSEKIKDAYVETVKAALDDSDPKTMSKEEYKDALEEIQGEVESRLTAVTEELEAEEP